MKFSAQQRDRHEAAVRHRIVDPVTGVRHCRWCLTAAPRVQIDDDGNVLARPQDGGEYLCPQCGRWQHERAFPDGVPGVSQAEHRCRNRACPTCANDDVLMFAHDADDPRCPTCGQATREVAP